MIWSVWRVGYRRISSTRNPCSVHVLVSTTQATMMACQPGASVARSRIGSYSCRARSVTTLYNINSQLVRDVLDLCKVAAHEPQVGKAPARIKRTGKLRTSAQG